MRRTGRALYGAVVAILATAGCGDDGGGERGIGRGDADTAIDVRLRDYAFQGIPASVKGPKVFVTATNAGSTEHELEILAADGTAVGEIGAMVPGKKGSMGVELPPGMYTVQCILTSGTGKPHADLGMKAPLRVE